MIFLSAQPAQPYFIWQLAVQIENFKKHKVFPGKMHILLGHEKGANLHPKVEKFINDYGDKASIFLYPDNRTSKKYVSSIRPNIIKQHYKAFPHLENENIFYHDSDIIFTTGLPDFDRLNADENWYFSDTKSYIDSQYIIERGGKRALTEMCRLLRIDEKLVTDNDSNAGGAQYLIKKVNAKFWDQIELDSEKLYTFLDDNKAKYANAFVKKTGLGIEQYIPISTWCADMWAVLWNSFKCASVKIDPSLDFCWPHYPLKMWNKVKIFHNSGVDISNAKGLFFKSLYHNHEPFDSDFSDLDKKKCSIMYAKQVQSITYKRKFDASDVTVIIPLRVDSNSRIENLLTVIAFLKKNFLINIIILEADKESKLPKSFPQGVQHIFISDHQELFHREFYNNTMAQMAKTTIIIKYDCDVILPPQQLHNAILSVRHKITDLCYPFDGRFINVHGELRKAFMGNLDIVLVAKYLDIYRHSFVPSFGGCCVLDRKKFIDNGMDNENFRGWGFEDQELHKRFKILGLSIGRETGPLYHLDHDRGVHSYFFDNDEMISSYQEYCKVCNMNRVDLITYIKSWSNAE